MVPEQTKSINIGFGEEDIPALVRQANSAQLNQKGIYGGLSKGTQST